MKHMVLALAVGIGVAACATDGPTASVPASFVGADISAFTAQYGSPTQVTPREDGTVVARFILADSRTGPASVPGSYTPRWERSRVQSTTRPQFVGSAHGATGAGVTVDAYTPRYQQCTIDVTISAAGRVEAVTTSQDTCHHISR